MDTQVSGRATGAPATPAVAGPAEPGRGRSFSARDWALLAGVATVWGSSFVLVAEGLETFAPPVVALLRLVFGAATLIWFRRARVPVERTDWPRLVILSVLWMAGPFLLFAIAQQWIASSLAGMINGGVPIIAFVVASYIAKSRPDARQMLGVFVGFAGVVTIGWSAVQGAPATALGVGLVLLATVSYGVAINVAAPLQKRYGALSVILRVQLVAVALTLVPGLMAIRQSTFSWSGLAAMVPLGALGTGLAFVGMVTLVGRVGPARSSLAIYFLPIVAIALGILVRGETITITRIIGTLMIIGGAVVASREAPATSR